MTVPSQHTSKFQQVSNEHTFLMHSERKDRGATKSKETSWVCSLSCKLLGIYAVAVPTAATGEPQPARNAKLPPAAEPTRVTPGAAYLPLKDQAGEALPPGQKTGPSLKAPYKSMTVKVTRRGAARARPGRAAAAGRSRRAEKDVYEAENLGEAAKQWPTTEPDGVARPPCRDAHGTPGLGRRRAWRWGRARLPPPGVAHRACHGDTRCPGAGPVMTCPGMYAVCDRGQVLQ